MPEQTDASAEQVEAQNEGDELSAEELAKVAGGQRDAGQQFLGGSQADQWQSSANQQNAEVYDNANQ